MITFSHVAESPGNRGRAGKSTGPTQAARGAVTAIRDVSPAAFRRTWDRQDTPVAVARVPHHRPPPGLFVNSLIIPGSYWRPRCCRTTPRSCGATPACPVRQCLPDRFPLRDAALLYRLRAPFGGPTRRPGQLRADDRLLPGAGPGLAARSGAERFVATAVGDVAELLDVHVDRLTGPFAFVAAYGPAGRAVQVREPGRTEAGRHPVHGRRGQAEEAGDAVRSPPAQEPDLDDPPLDPGRGRRGLVCGRLERSAMPASPNSRYGPSDAGPLWAISGSARQPAAALCPPRPRSGPGAGDRSQSGVHLSEA